MDCANPVTQPGPADPLAGPPLPCRGRRVSWEVRAQIARPNALPDHSSHGACDLHLAAVCAHVYGLEGRYGALDVRPRP